MNKQTKNYQQRILYQVRLSFKIGGEVKISSDKQKLQKPITTKIAPEEMLLRVLQVETKNATSEKKHKSIKLTIKIRM